MEGEFRPGSCSSYFDKASDKMTRIRDSEIFSSGRDNVIADTINKKSKVMYGLTIGLNKKIMASKWE